MTRDSSRSVPKLRITRYARARGPIRDPVTKFGGQPTWLKPARWPISKGWKTPMRFICQIRLDPLFGASPRLAFLFLTQADRDEIENGAFDPDIVEAGSGESAVLIQAGTTPFATPVAGPTLYRYDGAPCELSCELERDDDPPYIARAELPVLGKKDHPAFDTYCDRIAGDKIGGTPSFLNNDSWPRLAGGPWSLLLQLLPKRRPNDPYYLNLGATLSTGFAFLSASQEKGCFLVD